MVNRTTAYVLPLVVPLSLKTEDMIAVLPSREALEDDNKQTHYLVYVTNTSDNLYSVEGFIGVTTAIDGKSYACFKVRDRFKADYDKFVLGSYSTMSLMAKKLIISFADKDDVNRIEQVLTASDTSMKQLAKELTIDNDEQEQLVLYDVIKELNAIEDIVYTNNEYLP